MYGIKPNKLNEGFIKRQILKLNKKKTVRFDSEITRLHKKLESIQTQQSEVSNGLKTQ